MNDLNINIISELTLNFYLIPFQPKVYLVILLQKHETLGHLKLIAFTITILIAFRAA